MVLLVSVSIGRLCEVEVNRHFLHMHMLAYSVATAVPFLFRWDDKVRQWQGMQCLAAFIINI